MNKEIFIIIGKNIKKYRKEKNYTTKDLSIITNIEENKLKNYEKNGVDGNITFNELNLISTSLEINIIKLFKK